MWEASEEELIHLGKKGCTWTERLRSFRRSMTPDAAEGERKKQGIRFVSVENENYPSKLAQLQDRPFGIFVRGELPDPSKKCVAIVGARMCMRAGKEMAEHIAAWTAMAGGITVSGGAHGIDGAAQWASLEQGARSFAVLGCGVDRCYPASHRALFARLYEEGGVISEFPPGTAPQRIHFPIRNRIISGLADLVVVVEARKRSGSLITAGYAAEQGRLVMAVPGRPGDELSEGCNELIAQGAGIILSKESFHAEFFPEYAEMKKNTAEKFALAPAEKLVYSSVGLHAKSVWELGADTALPPDLLSDALISLEIKGLVKETDRNYYTRL